MQSIRRKTHRFEAIRPLGESDFGGRRTIHDHPFRVSGPLSDLSLRMICSALYLVRFMVRTPDQSGRMRTLIHPGPISGVHVRRPYPAAMRLMGLPHRQAIAVELLPAGAPYLDERSYAKLVNGEGATAKVK